MVGRADDVVLPGFEGFSIYRIGRFFLQALSDGQLAMRASAIAFKVFIAFFPAVIMLLTLIPFIPIDDFQIKLLVTFRTWPAIASMRYCKVSARAPICTRGIVR